MESLLPAALSGLAFAAVPLIIHLLTRQRAPRVAFPSVRFVRPSMAAAVRLRKPSDIRLLVVRAVIVALAALAAAQPLFLTSWRLAAWNGRTARAIVVDTSESMQRVDATGREPAVLAGEAAEGEAASAFHVMRIETADLPDGLRRAVRWLEGAPPARREIVVISDFQMGTFSEAELVTVPRSLGIRFVRVGRTIDAHDVAGRPIGWQGAQWMPAVQVGQLSTKTTWTRAAERGAIGVAVSVQPGQEAAAAAAFQAAASFGAPVQTDRRVRVMFAGAGAIGSDAEPLRTAWIVNTVLALRRSDVRESVTRAAERDGVLLLQSSVPIQSVAAAALLRAVIIARAEPIVSQEAEVATISDGDLASWRRAPPAIDASISPRAEISDARWLWMVILGLLALESWMRRNRGATREARVDASAA